ncbi:MAG: glycosyl transferase family protein [Alphaproteobacteria bacterium]|nr:glycosyl transferase family protein [Alphaproteobacteria bacterium]
MARIFGSVQNELIFFAAVGFLIGSLDDLLVDIFWLARSLWKRVFIYTRHEAMTMATLPVARNTGPVAVFVPAWDEANVIGHMLRHCLKSWGNADFRIFVGCYSNDRATIMAVAAVAEQDERISMVIGANAGPTTKGDCLNAIWTAMLRQESVQGKSFKAVVLHDAEDVVHPGEIRLFDTMIDRFDLVQLPVLPLVNPHSRWVSGHYCDEFAEAHGKYLVVREAIGAAMPSAGVGCAFARAAIASIADQQDGLPFDPGCLTEDYELGLRIGALGGRGVFIHMADEAGGLVCTREYFPDTLDAAVRQKARWMTGIALAGWDRLGWHGSLAERWMRLRDRRAPLAAIILCCAYVSILLYGVIDIAHLMTGTNIAPLRPSLEILLTINAVLLLWRLAIRCAFVTRYYGWREGARSVPRAFLANIIAIMAARQAVFHYLRINSGHAPVWDKTAHHFPTELAREA